MQTIYDPNVPGFFRSLFIVRSVLYDLHTTSDNNRLDL